jgi:hypothetical protein
MFRESDYNLDGVSGLHHVQYDLRGALQKKRPKDQVIGSEA